MSNGVGELSKQEGLPWSENIKLLGLQPSDINADLLFLQKQLRLRIAILNERFAIFDLMESVKEGDITLKELETSFMARLNSLTILLTFYNDLYAEAFRGGIDESWFKENILKNMYSSVTKTTRSAQTYFEKIKDTLSHKIPGISLSLLLSHLKDHCKKLKEQSLGSDNNTHVLMKELRDDLLQYLINIEDFLTAEKPVLKLIQPQTSKETKHSFRRTLRHMCTMS